MNDSYVHGYQSNEVQRLQDQAGTLSELLHADTCYKPGARVLEVGCGVGAQTRILAQRNPQTSFTCIDTNAESVAEARQNITRHGLHNVELKHADIFDAPFDAASFDDAFICFVLEHLPNPVDCLTAVLRLLKPGAGITVIEGDHGSTFFHPASEAADKAVKCQVELQRRLGGNAMVGRRLYPLMAEAGLNSIRVSPRLVYVDDSKPALIDGFTRKTFTAMIEGVREPAISAGLTTPEEFDLGVQALHRTSEPGGVFCYTFFKGVGSKAH